MTGRPAADTVTRDEADCGPPPVFVRTVRGRDVAYEMDPRRLAAVDTLRLRAAAAERRRRRAANRAARKARRRT